MAPPRDPPLPPDVYDQLAARYQTAMLAVREHVVAQVAREWATLDLDDSDASLASVLGAVLTLVHAGQTEIAALSVGHVRAVVALSGEAPSAALTAADFATATLDDLTPQGALYGALGDGAGRAAALAKGETKITRDVREAVTHAADDATMQAAAQEPSLKGFYRVPRSGACLACAADTDHLYAFKQSIPRHPYCGCGVRLVGSGIPKPHTRSKRAMWWELSEAEQAKLLQGKGGADFAAALQGQPPEAIIDRTGGRITERSMRDVQARSA